MNQLFVVRQYLCLDRRDEIRVDEECFFSTKREAVRKLKQLYDTNVSEEVYALFRNELTEAELGGSGYYTTKIFSMQGECLEFRKYDSKGYRTRFFRRPPGLVVGGGQIVNLYANIESGHSPFINTKLAVVLPYQASKKELSFGYINNAGYFNHFHSDAPIVKSVCHSSSSCELKVLQSAYQVEAHSKKNEISIEFIKFLSGELSILELCYSTFLSNLSEIK